MSFFCPLSSDNGTIKKSPPPPSSLLTSTSISNNNNHNLVHFVTPKSLFQYFNGHNSAIYQVNPVQPKQRCDNNVSMKTSKSTKTTTTTLITSIIPCSATIQSDNDSPVSPNSSKQSSLSSNSRDFSSSTSEDTMISEINNDNDSEICCLLAEGSPTCFISNFSSMIELYEKIAHCFDISAKEIMYCTLNTPKIDMDQVLCGQICPNDIVFVHRKGRRKDVEVRKSEQFLGLTIADNGYGCSYIKKIRTNSTASRVPFIQVGDQIESIMEQNMLGNRHYEVARFLKSIPLNEIFTITLIEPVAAIGNNVQLRIINDKSPTNNNNNNNQTNHEMIKSKYNHNNNAFKIRHHQYRNRNHNHHHRIINNENGQKCSKSCYDEIDDKDFGVENHDDDDDDDDERILSYKTGIYYINKQLEKFIGINDDELAEELWLMATTTTTTTNNNNDDTFTLKSKQQQQQQQQNIQMKLIVKN
ncbi:pdz domain-containing protein gipc3 [Dermatophagoides farinae]|uniref:Pdz domain-containing protein gipc3 n=1 Tax=Dermatophagoides farinae TaxID=6954 RepID=A0A9D4P4L0_DERFA|nr:pdz domain-containing protein gipc3 [Dermatophagoides farinae]